LPRLIGSTTLAVVNNRIAADAQLSSATAIR